MPVFISDEIRSPEEIDSMPGVLSMVFAVQIVNQVGKWVALGIRAFAIFPKINPTKKTITGENLNPKSLTYEVGRLIKSNFSQVSLIGDLALDPYTSTVMMVS